MANIQFLPNISFVSFVLMYLVGMPQAIILNSSSHMQLDPYGTLAIQTPNKSVPILLNGIDFFRSIRLSIQCIQTPCPPAYYRVGCEPLMMQGGCSPCPTCPNGQYRTGCGGLNPGLCLKVSICAYGKFEIQAATPTSDRLCVIPPCLLGEYETHPPTKTTARQCATLTTCNSNEYEMYTPTATTDRKCQACSNVTNHVLNCADTSSRAFISSKHICEVERVNNCCCDEIGVLKRVNGDVFIRNDETMVHFSSIEEIKGSVNSDQFYVRNRGLLGLVNFGKVTKVLAIQLEFNRITQVKFGSLALVEGPVVLSENEITSMYFGTITSIKGPLQLQKNAISSIDFAAIRSIDGAIWLERNALTSIEFGSIEHIGGSLLLNNNALTNIYFGDVSVVDGWVRVENNPLLSSIKCHNMGDCLCRSNHTSPINCPEDCNFHTCI